MGTYSKELEQINSLVEQLTQYQEAYYKTGRSIVSDLEYDRLFDELVQLEAQFPDLQRSDSPTVRVGSDLSSELPEVSHSIPVLSLDKVYSADTLEEWMEKTRRKVGDTEISFTVEEKIDGISIVLYYREGLLFQAVTRGNGAVGNDVTANVRTVRSVPLRLAEPVTIAVRGEIYLPVGEFESLNGTLETPFANPRNLTAGTIRRKKSRDVAAVPLEIFVYEAYFEESARQPESHDQLMEALIRLGLPVNNRFGKFSSQKGIPLRPEWISGAFSDLPGYIEQSTEARKSLDYEIDGLVIKVNELEVRAQLGYTGHHPRWAVAYKFDAPQSETIVENITVQVGRTGRITPVARVKPVQIGGSVVSNVTLHNQDYIDMLELALNDRVAVSKRGDVIPAVERVVEKNEQGNSIWKMPTACPSCGTVLTAAGAHTFCRNLDCPDQVFGRIQFFVGRDQMDIGNLGPETIRSLMQQGLLHDIPDIYHLDYEKIGEMAGFGSRKVALLQDGVKKSLDKPYRTVLASLGIPDLGKKAVELLINDGIDSIDQLLDIVDTGQRDRLIAIKGFGEKTADSILLELGRDGVRQMIESLKRAGLQFAAIKDDSPQGEQIFADQVWCVTGSFKEFNPRSRAMEEVKLRGGRTVSSVTGKTTHLLAGAGAGSKLEKAKSLGITVIDEQQFLDMIENS